MVREEKDEKVAASKPTGWAAAAVGSLSPLITGHASRTGCKFRAERVLRAGAFYQEQTDDPGGC